MNHDQNTAVNELSNLDNLEFVIKYEHISSIRSCSYSLIRQSETYVLNLYKDQ